MNVVYSFLIMTLLYHGHINYTPTMTINKDNSVTYSERIELEKNISEYDSIDFSNEQLKKEYKILGIGFNPIENDTHRGVVLTKTYESINDLSSEVDTECDINLAEKKVDNQYCFKKVKGFFFNTYYAKISNKAIVDSIRYSNDNREYKEISEEEESTYYNYDYYKNHVKVNYVVSLPYEVLSSNANNKKNNTLTWYVSDTKPKYDYFEYSFRVPNYLNMLLAGGATVLVVFLTFSVLISYIINIPKKARPVRNTRQEDIEMIDLPADNARINNLLQPDDAFSKRPDVPYNQNQNVDMPMPRQQQPIEQGMGQAPLPPMEDDEPIESQWYE